MARRIQMHWFYLVGIIFALAAPTGCVRFHDVDGGTPSISQGVDGTGGMARAPGTGGSSGTNNAGATCNAAMCQPSPLGFSACCTEDTDVCGLEASKVFAGAGCLEADAPGAIDSACPAGNLTISGSSVAARGCCRDDNTCGLMDTVAGLGCTADPSKPKGAACGESGSGNTGSTCDVATCPTSSFGLSSCCTDTGCCGYDATALSAAAGCLEADAPGSADSSCPSAMVTVMGFTVDLPGCCRGDGTCGVMDSFAGLGCTLNPDMPMGASCAGPN